MSATDIYRDNPYEIEFTVQKRAAASGALAPATGITDLIGYLAAAPDGAAINPALSVTLVERSGKPGTYSALIAAAVINAQLFDGATSYNGASIYVVAKNADIHVNAKVKARLVRTIV